MSVQRVGASAPLDRRRVAPHKTWRDRRWPSFIIWRWAGRAQVGWTPCPQRVLPLLLLHLLRRPHPPSILMSRRPAEGRAERAGHGVVDHGAAGPGGNQPNGRLRAAAASRPARAPRKAPAGRPRSRANRQNVVGAARPGRAPGSPPAQGPGSPPAQRAGSPLAQGAGNPLDGRAPPGRPRGSEPRRGVAAGVSRVGPGRQRSL